MDETYHTAPAVTHEQDAIIFVALELSGSCWHVAVQAPGSDQPSRHRVKAGAAGELLALLARQRERAERRLGRVLRVVSCYEAGWDGFWLHRVLTRAGIENHVMEAASLAVSRRARRAKTDRLDVGLLLRALMAWHRGEVGVCAMVRVPSVAQEDAKRTGRERARLLKERIGHVNRIKGLLATQGIYDYEPMRARRRERLEELRTGDGRELAGHLKAELERQLDRLELVLKLLARVEAERDEPVRAARAASAVVGGAADGAQARLGLLVRVKGIGAELASTLEREVLYRRFANRREIASYVGLTPSLYASGGLAREQGISKAGNGRARQALVELAWLWLRHQPESELSRWFHGRVGAARGRGRRIAIVALARKLLVALWRYVSSGVVPTGMMVKA